MNYLDGKNFSEEKKYIDAIFKLSGLSECGKSSAGIRMASSPFEIKRYKIIEIETDKENIDIWVLMTKYYQVPI